jgi:hypothetical protein
MKLFQVGSPLNGDTNFLIEAENAESAYVLWRKGMQACQLFAISMLPVQVFEVRPSGEAGILWPDSEGLVDVTP